MTRDRAKARRLKRRLLAARWHRLRAAKRRKDRRPGWNLAGLRRWQARALLAVLEAPRPWLAVARLPGRTREDRDLDAAILVEGGWLERWTDGRGVPSVTLTVQGARRLGAWIGEFPRATRHEVEAEIPMADGSVRVIGNEVETVESEPEWCNYLDAEPRPRATKETASWWHARTYRPRPGRRKAARVSHRDSPQGPAPNPAAVATALGDGGRSEFSAVLQLLNNPAFASVSFLKPRRRA